MEPPARFIRRSVPNDNDCLFSAILYLMEGRVPAGGAAALRQHCAAVIGANPELYSEAVLGMDNAAYRAWITNKFNWGGETEVVILCEKYGVEIAIVSCESFRTLVYGEGAPGCAGRVFLLYTGQHYDPLVGAPPAAAADERAAAVPEAAETRVFAPGAPPGAALEESALALARDAAAAAAKKLREKRKKVIKCGGCGALCDDADAFQAHCMEVEHDDDFMYDCEEVEVVVADDGPDAAGGWPDLADASLVVTAYASPGAPLSHLFEGAPFALDGRAWPTAMHYYHAAQFDPAADGFGALADRIAAAASAAEAAQVATYAEGVPTRADWAASGREAALLAAARAKFAQHEALRAELLATGDRLIVLLDPNKFLGVDASGGAPNGRNHVGKALMAVRAELAAEVAGDP